MMDILLDGYTDLPAGKLINIATFLEMKGGEKRQPPYLQLEREIAPDVEKYRAMLLRIGEPWLWVDGLSRTQTQLNNENTYLYYLHDFGLLELSFSHMECEILYFGIAQSYIGQGFGSKLMDFAIYTAFKNPISRLWLHTCTIDHPKALEFYMTKGFKPYKRAIEIVDDPRLTGLLPRENGKHFPIIENEWLSSLK